MSELDNIFRKNLQEKLSGHESPVDPSVWSAVQSSVASTAGSAGSAVTGGFFSGIAGKAIVAAVILATLVTGLVLVTDSDKETASPAQTTTQDHKEIDSSENTKEKLQKNIEEDTSSSTAHASNQKQNEAVENENPDGQQESIAIAKEQEDANQQPNQETTTTAGVTGNGYDIGETGTSMDRGESTGPTVDSDSPTAEFYAEADYFDPLTYEFTASMSGAQRYDWIIDETQVLSGEEVQFEFEEYGVHTVKLSVMDKYGRTEITSQEVIIEAECTCKMPNVFTPNGDNFNPLFKPKSLSDGMQLLSIEVFTLEGELIYSGDESPKYWDGRKMNGDEAPAGLYVYSMRFECLDGRTNKQEDKVHLNR
ncbi:MAG: gliding motility-associated C-terminal domain-containing protein [Bacteroidota bacterium]